MSNEKKRKSQDDPCRDFNKKTKEERYASLYKHFEPLSHTRYFINRSTDEETLESLIRTASSSNEFTIDTESVNIPGKGNEPALIQLLMIRYNHPSSVVIIEPHHLPHEHHPHFELIKQLFQVVLSPEKTSFIFGPKTELKPFAQFRLFSLEQIQAMTCIDLQRNFKQYWQEQHPHRQANPTNITRMGKCRCEQCIGKNSTDLWSLQDCVAYELDQYLPKLYSQSKFNIGLDAKLRRLNNDEIIYRRNLSEYAYNDCLSMETIIKQLKQRKFKFNVGQPSRNRRKSKKTSRMISISDSDSDDDGEIYLSQINPVNNQQSNKQPPTIYSTNRTISFSNKEPTTIHSTNRTISHSNVQPTTTHSTSRTVIFSSESSKNRTISLSNERLNRQISVPSNEICPSDEIFPSNEHLNRQIPIVSSNEISTVGIELPTNNQRDDKQQILTAEERRKIHNRSCTRKQRRRAYRRELIFRNVDHRFSITKIKKILRGKGIEPTALNKSKNESGQISLFVGIEEHQSLEQCKEKLRHGFTTHHYDQWRRDNQSNHRENHREDRYKDGRRNHPGNHRGNHRRRH